MEVDSVTCGDALEWLKTLPDGSVDCIVTDPPYGCGTQVSARRSPAERFDEIEGALAINADWLPEAYRVLKQGAAAYAFAKWVNMGEWKALMEAAGFDVRNCIVWDKLQHGTGDLTGAYGPQHELILFATKGRHKLRGSRPVDVIRYPKVQPTDLVHPYEKPVGLLEKLIRSSTDEGGIVLDCFAGSGATLKAARQARRHWLGCELSHEYAALIERSMSKPYSIDMFAALHP